jgi:signal transduction histidine kinase
MRSQTVVLILASGVVAAAAELVAVARAEPLLLSVADGLVGFTALTTSAVVHDRHRSERMAVLFAATGLAWLAGTVVPLLVFAHRGPLVHLVLAYPTGRLRRWGAPLVGLVYVTALLPVLGRNAWVSLAVAVLLLGGALLPSAGGPGLAAKPEMFRLIAATPLAAALGLSAVSSLLGLHLDRAVLWLYDVATLTALLAIALGLIRFQRVAAVTDLVVDLGRRTGILTDAVARSLNDPGLTIGYWVPEQSRFVDESGRAVDVNRPGEGRVVTPITSAGKPMAVLIHDQNVLNEWELVEAVAAGTRLMVANARLQAEAQLRLDELMASRRRIVEAGDVQRAKLEAELRTGVQSQLHRVDELLADARAAAPTQAELLDQLKDGLATARAEVEELARGLHPRLLSEQGLAAALAALPSSVPTVIQVETGRFAAPAEAAIYFACAEAVANVAKHAAASEVQIRLTRDGDSVTATVTDNGVGGADVGHGSGLAGIRDRVEALSGRLTLSERTGGGTILTVKMRLPASGSPGGTDAPGDPDLDLVPSL